MCKTINIVFDNAPSAHKLGILKDISEDESLLIIHLRLMIPALKLRVESPECIVLVKKQKE